MREEILRAEHIKMYFPIRGALGKIRNYVKAVDDVSLSLYKGETYGLVGETGCGKSTLGRTLIRLLKATGGTVTYKGKNLFTINEKELRRLCRELQMVFQDPYTSLNPRMRVGEALTEVLKIQGIGDKDARMADALSVFEKVGLLPEHFYRFPHEFSGGQRQRIGLARALILNPELIICDEPVSALDVSVQSQIINLLLDMQEERGLTYLFISHDMSVIRYIADRVGVMYLGHLVEEAPVDDLFLSPSHPYTQVLLSAVPSDDPHVRKERVILEGDLPSPANPPAGCVFSTRCPYAKQICREKKPECTDINETHRVYCHLTK
ncbi:MAG: ABC transporter ATP-binding protein [Lachnospiraceae bacterium]|nr:ABC transporter ATP-binding protein [Lachnospiraceae bacterium]